ncbi:MAG: hypothetical protein FWF52_11445 [Candidatus Azobacteroides sp.]|nr:hypothetical protein [Candidatus Azobacteroides sp.]
MKKNILFFIVIGLLFIILYEINRNNPEQQYVWNPTYGQNDKQPYGAYALDKILKASWKNEYIHSYKNFFGLYTFDAVLDDKNLFIVCNQLILTDSDWKYFWKYIETGGNVLIAAESFQSALEDTLQFETTTRYSNFSLPLNLSSKQKTTSLIFGKNRIQGIPRSMLRYFFNFPKEIDSIPVSKKFTLAFDDENHPIMLRYPIGKGNLIVSCTPLLFTNYAVLNDSIHPFIWQSLAYLKGKPLVRTEYYEKGDFGGNSESVFRYLLSQPSLRWAYYITLATLILMMFFTAKRKQSPIPVVNPPPNKMLDFVRSISSLYLIKNNNTDIILKKYIYWGDSLKKEYGIDPINEEHTPDFIRQFANKIGMDENEAKHLFAELDRMRENSWVSDENMMDLITKMKIDSWKN